MSMRTPTALCAAGFACTFALAAPVSAAGDWAFYGGDAGGTRWSELAQIDRSNVARLTEVWRIRTGDLDVVPPPFGATPTAVSPTAAAAAV